MTVQSVRRDIDAYLRPFGALKFTAGYVIPCATGSLQFEVNVRGSITTHIGLDRWRARDVTGYTAEQWLRENVWPYMNRWCAHTRRANTMPSPGSFSSGTVLTGEALDLLQVWLPQELAWQAALGEPPDLNAYRRRREAAS